MSKTWPGSLITKTPVTPAGPYEDDAAPGVWTLSEQAFWQKQGLWPIPGNVAPIGLFGGGYTTVASNVVNKIIFTTFGNATDFGDLSVARYNISACSSDTRGIFAGGQTSGGAGGESNVIDYMTFSTTGNAIDFGDLTNSRFGLSGSSNYVRGVFGGGRGTTTNAVNIIDYITIASTGNAIDFGDLTEPRYSLGSVSSSTRSVWGGGYSNNLGTEVNIIDYITTASTGNALDFGDLSGSRFGLAGCGSETRGIFGGGNAPTYTKSMVYITIASTGN